MYIMKQNGRVVVNTEYVDHYNVLEKSEAVLVAANLTTGQPITLGQYKDAKEARQVLGELYAALIGGQSGFDMPESRLYAEEYIKKDARTKRRGGS